MQTQVVQTHTTSAVAVFAHDDIVRVLGLATLLDAKLPRDVPGTTVTVELAPADADGRFTATASVLIDHNYVAPPEPEQSDGAGDGSLKSDGSAATEAPQTPPAAPAIPPVPPVGGLQIPVAPAA